MSKLKKKANSPQLTADKEKTETAIWFTDRLKHSKQIRCYKKCAVFVIALMYFSFFVLLGFIIFCPEYRKILEDHRRFLGVLLALVIVLSALAWGVIRAVFKAESETTADVLKAASSTHPFFNS